MTRPLFLFWQPDHSGPGLRLLRVWGDTPCPALPAALHGQPITQVGPYCFSPRVPPCTGPVWVSPWGGSGAAGPACAFESLPRALEAPGRPGGPLCGDFLQQVALPAGAHTLDSAAFYNCRRLEQLTVGPALNRLGSDVFTNCAALELLALGAAPGQATGLRRLLACLPQDLTVRFGPADAPQALLFFPEFTELLYENGPAHIFARSIQGVGYRYRQCFDGTGALQFAEYDSGFARALTAESPRTLARIAFCRLRFPFGLSAPAAAAYRACCREQGQALAEWLLEGAEADSADLAFACAQGLLPPAARAWAAEQAARRGLARTAALLLQAGRAAPAPKRYDF